MQALRLTDSAFYCGFEKAFLALICIPFASITFIFRVALDQICVLVFKGTLKANNSLITRAR